MKNKTKQQQPLFSNRDYELLLKGITKNHMDLVKWLYDNHLDILRKYEKTRGKLSIHFLIKGDKK